MGKGSRNRLNREVEPKKEIKVKKKKKTRKPLSAMAKKMIAGAICLLIVAGIVFGSLASAGTFKRTNILVHSKVGAYNLDQQAATYMIWDACYYQAYVQWSYLQDTIKSSTGITDQGTWCLMSAQSGVQETLLTSLNTYGETLREYIAICDFAAQNNIALTKEEKKEAREQAKEYIEYMASTLGYNTKGFIGYFIGNNVKMKDIEKAAEIQSLCQKVYDLKQTEHESAVDNDTEEKLINAFVKDNPETFYTTDYFVVNTASTTLKDALLATTSPEEFKIALVKDAFDNGDTNFKTIFNKHGTTLIDDATAVLNAIKGKTGDELTAALNGQGMAAIEYTKDAEGTNASLNTWLFTTSKGVQYASDIIYTADTIYVAILTTAVTGDKVTAAVKEISKQSGESYGSDLSFKENFYKTVLVKLGLYEKADGDVLYTDTEDASVKNMLNEFVPILEKVIPAVKTEAFVKEAAEGEDAAWDAGSYQEWMFKGTTAELVPAKGKGAVTAIAETKEENGEKKETGKFNVYMIVEPMKLDLDPLVNGGYIKFSGEGHAAAAQTFLESLSGLTGDALAEKFSSYTVAEDSKLTATPSVSEAISKDGVSEATLATWLFDASRTANSTVSIAVADNTSTSDKDESCTYVAFYLGQKPAWKVSAKNNYVSDQISTWVDGLIASYEITGTKRIKDKAPATSENETETDEHGHAAH